jgi:chemotaxis protein CheZ
MADRMPQRPFTAERQTRALRGLHSDRSAHPTESEGVPIMETLARLESQLAELTEGLSGLRYEAGSPAGDSLRAEETRRELAALAGHGEGRIDRIEAAEQELAAIVEATETATQTILEAAEEIDRVVGEIAAGADPVVAEQLTEAADAVVRIYQASTFQDITGQRIDKVVRTLAFIDARLTALSHVWQEDREPAGPAQPGPDAASAADDGAEAAEGWDDSHLLNGPQLDNQGISQAEIDKLFD